MVFVATILPNLAAGSVYAQSMQSNGNAALSLVEINEILEEELHSDDDAEPIILSDFIWVIVLEELPEIFVNKVQTPPPRLVIG